MFNGKCITVFFNLFAHSRLTDKCSQLRQSSSLLFRWIWSVLLYFFSPPFAARRNSIITWLSVTWINYLCLTSNEELRTIRYETPLVLCIQMFSRAMYFQTFNCQIWCDFDRASSLICGNKMPTRCNWGFYCSSYCLLNTFRAPLCPSSGAQEYYTDAAASCKPGT